MGIPSGQIPVSHREGKFQQLMLTVILAMPTSMSAAAADLRHGCSTGRSSAPAVADAWIRRCVHSGAYLQEEAAAAPPCQDDFREAFQELRASSPGRFAGS